jgi:hypothetical protein
MKKTQKKATAKKAKTVQKVSKPKKTTHEIVVSVQTQPNLPTVSDLAQPMREGKALSITKTWVSDKQIMRMVQRTPREHIYTRPAKGGGQWSYVTGTYVEKVLNFVFGFLWDFEVLDHGKEGDQIWVKGKLTAKSPTGQTIVKTQFGRADIKFKKDGKGMLDFGNDLKAATTDSLKKCASLLGIASDIYGKAEFKDAIGQDIPETQTVPKTEKVEKRDVVVLKKDQVIGPDGEPTYLCSETGEPISEAIYSYSMKVFGKALSKEAQANYKPKNK